MTGVVLTEAELFERMRVERAAGRTFAFANGCFDVLHVGHVRYLAGAAAETAGPLGAWFTAVALLAG